MKYTSKTHLVSSIENEHARLVEVVFSLPRRRLTTKGVWGDQANGGWSVKDLLIHLTVWEQMFLAWYRAGLAGETPAMPAAGYTWKDVPQLNRDIQRRHARKSVANTLVDFESSYTEILELARELPELDLLERHRVAWTGTSTLASYLGANSASHYRTATRIVRRWIKSQDESSYTSGSLSDRR
ncbi:MAG: ClbS/DfsB family four-helix bundle protein [Planctomycetota bacterium]